MLIIDKIIVWSIPVLSFLGIWGVGSKNRHRRFGYLLSVITQGLWIYISIKTKQAWLFVNTIIFTIAWARGLYNNWRE